MPKASLENNGLVKIYCLGCKNHHYLTVAKNNPKHWEFDNNFEQPTFSPSLLVRSGKFAGSKEWYDNLAPDEREFVDNNSSICHSYIRRGTIEYLHDSTHHLAGKTVELPEVQ